MTLVSVNGRKAVRFVEIILTRGLLPLPSEPYVVNQSDIQICGTGILVRAMDIRIQVKCDYRGGCRDLGGTGHLYLRQGC